MQNLCRTVALLTLGDGSRHDTNLVIGRRYLLGSGGFSFLIYPPPSDAAVVSVVPAAVVAGVPEEPPQAQSPAAMATDSITAKNLFVIIKSSFSF